MRLPEPPTARSDSSGTDCIPGTRAAAADVAAMHTDPTRYTLLAAYTGDAGDLALDEALDLLIQTGGVVADIACARWSEAARRIDELAATVAEAGRQVHLAAEDDR